MHYNQPHRMSCPHCRINCRTTDVSFSAHTVKLDGYCPLCKKELYMESPLSEAVPKEDVLLFGIDLNNWQPKGKPH